MCFTPNPQNRFPPSRMGRSKLESRREWVVLQKDFQLWQHCADCVIVKSVALRSYWNAGERGRKMKTFNDYERMITEVSCRCATTELVARPVLS